MKNIYFSCKLTGLHQQSTLISIGLITDNDKIFYAEFNDYQYTQLDDWTEKNILNKLVLNRDNCVSQSSLFEDDSVKYYGNSFEISIKLKEWLLDLSTSPSSIRMVGDSLCYDWVLFCELFGGSMYLPYNIINLPYDISMDFVRNGYKQDCDRISYLFQDVEKKGIQLVKKIHEFNQKKHNALHDALVTKLCYEKITIKYETTINKQND